jgi:hypothetical protein
MKTRIMSALVALIAAFGMAFMVAEPAHASTGYKVASCHPAESSSYTLTVSSWIEDNGRKTWHWKASAPYFKNVQAALPSGTMGYVVTEGFLNTSDRINIYWYGHWVRYGLQYQCRLSV